MRKWLATDAAWTASATAAAPAHQTLPLHVEGLGYDASGRVLLSDVSFDVPVATFNIVLGPNGAGKSLLLRLCHGLLRPHHGAIAWNGLAPEHARVHHAMIFQRPVMLRRSVAANINYPLAIRHVPHATRRQLVREALEATDLAHLARTPATRLSGGEQQRVAIARAWVLQPEVLLLDEPSANLDPRSSSAIELLVQRMHQQGTTVIMTTHDLAQARRLAERVLFFHRGYLLEDAPASRFFAQPENLDAQAFLEGKLLA